MNILKFCALLASILCVAIALHGIADNLPKAEGNTQAACEQRGGVWAAFYSEELPGLCLDNVTLIQEV